MFIVCWLLLLAIVVGYRCWLLLLVIVVCYFKFPIKLKLSFA